MEQSAERTALAPESTAALGDMRRARPSLALSMETDRRGVESEADAEVGTPENSAWPKQIYYIMGNEVCERFSFYGMRAILVVYMTNYLHIAVSDAESAFHLFTAASYFLPLVGGWLADNVLGKYRVVLYLSVFYCLGHGVLALWETRAGLTIGLALVSIGAGGIKPCVGALVGDQFDEAHKHLLQGVFATFYWCINLGSFTAMATTPMLLQSSVFWAFSLPGISMAVALAVFWAGRHLYIIVGPKDAGADQQAGFLKVFGTALKGWWRREPGQGFWGPSSEKFSKEELEAAQSVTGLCQLFACLCMYSALFDQNSSTWVVQAQEMDLNVFGWEVPAAQMQALNPVCVMALIPTFEKLVYPGLAAMGLRLTPLRKMGAGLCLTSLSFIIIGFLQVGLDAGRTISVLWQAPAYVILTSCEVLVSVTGLQFAYTQAPHSMKSTIMSIWLLTVFAGNAFVAVVTKIDVFKGASLFFFFAALMLVVAALFVWLAVSYRGREYTVPARRGPAPSLGAEDGKSRIEDEDKSALLERTFGSEAGSPGEQTDSRT